MEPAGKPKHLREQSQRRLVVMSVPAVLLLAGVGIAAFDGGHSQVPVLTSHAVLDPPTSLAAVVQGTVIVAPEVSPALASSTTPSTLSDRATTTTGPAHPVVPASSTTTSTALRHSSTTVTTPTTEVPPSTTEVSVTTDPGDTSGTIAPTDNATIPGG